MGEEVRWVIVKEEIESARRWRWGLSGSGGGGCFRGALL